MPLPDQAFFELIRTVFGKIKTPFNKQNLVGDLEKFLSNGDIQKNIAAYIDKNDARVIAAVALLGEPAAAELDAFLEPDFGRAELRDLVINLEERFVLFRFTDENKNESRLALNPVLEPVLARYTENTAALLPSFRNETPDEAGGRDLPFFDDRILAALLSFVSHNKPFFIKEGRIRRKVLNAAAAVFPAMRFETVIGGLRVLGLFFADGDTLFPDYARFAAFGRLERTERLEYCAAGILCYYGSPANELSPWLFRQKLRRYTAFIHDFYTSLDPERQYPVVTLKRLAFITGGNGNDIDCDTLIKAMEQTCLLFSNPDKRWQKTAPVPERGIQGKPPAKNAPTDAPAGGAPLGATIAADSPFTLLMYPEIAYNDAVALASLSRVTGTGLNVRFEIDKDTAASAFNRGITATSAIGLLQRLSGNRIDENAAFALLDWEKRYREISLYKGLVLSLSPERLYLAETKPLSKYIITTLADGIYLIPENLEDKVYTALKKAGVTIFAKPDSGGGAPAGANCTDADGLKDRAADSRVFFPRLNSGPQHAGITGQLIRQTEKDETDGLVSGRTASALTGEFHSIINKMSLKAEQRDELAARINRRLVLCEAQLRDAVVRYEKLEARGLDYAGKIMIVKQAIAGQSPLEVSWPGRQKQESVTGIPKALEKTGGESVLVMEPAGGNTVSFPENAVRIPLGKISLLRRIKKSIFEINN